VAIKSIRPISRASVAETALGLPMVCSPTLPLLPRAARQRANGGFEDVLFLGFHRLAKIFALRADRAGLRRSPSQGPWRPCMTGQG